MCVATAVLEAGLVPMEEPETRLCLESPGGLIQVLYRGPLTVPLSVVRVLQVRATCRGGRVLEVAMTTLPSFLGARDVKVTVPGLGQVRTRGSNASHS